KRRLCKHFKAQGFCCIVEEMLTQSSFEPLAQLSAKIRGELRYHTMHANTWIKQLGSATTESITRLQKSLEYALPYALGMFEKSPFENALISEGIFAGEQVLEDKWKRKVEEVLAQTQLQLPAWDTITPHLGGRVGKHTEHLQPLLDEMSEVLRIDPTAEW
ncbi:MAG TPA: phenylacetate-CoA oxygenase subunit PaaI, partial [Cytophagales bacterium]|nr:phenylacetate-CoA oxygenase subunit PaaI [Cytophagales bacterium]